MMRYTILQLSFFLIISKDILTLNGAHCFAFTARAALTTKTTTVSSFGSSDFQRSLHRRALSMRAGDKVEMAPRHNTLASLLLAPDRVVGKEAGDPKDDTVFKNGQLSSHHNVIGAVVAGLVMAVGWSAGALPAHAAAGGAVLPSALWAYAHYVSIICIFGIICAERLLIATDMTAEDEDLLVKLDLGYGLLAALLIASGFFRATQFGKGGDFYIHEISFWVKMVFAGVWGGLSLFPSLTFYRRKADRKKGDVPPPSEKLVKRLHQIVNAEITAMVSIPLVATLMARGVGYWDDFPWPAGLVLALLATGGSFYLYGKQALTWKEEERPLVADE